MNLDEYEKRVYKMRRNGKQTESDELRYGGNFEVVESTYKQLYMDYFINLLINLITYENTPPSFDGRYLEYLLRCFGYARIGATDPDNIFIVNANNDENNPTNGIYGFLIDQGTIDDPTQDKTQLTQITRGNIYKLQQKKIQNVYVILSNKYNFYYGTGNQICGDFMLAERMAKTLATIKATEIFNMHQMKVPFIGFSNNKNLTAKNIWHEINSGMPFINVDTDIGDIRSTVDLFNVNIPNFLPQLKDEWNNNLSEFLTMLGINNIGVDKKERLVTNEVDANSQLIEASGKIYLEARNNQLQLINNLLGTQIKAVYNQESVNELLSLTQNSVSKTDENNGGDGENG